MLYGIVAMSESAHIVGRCSYFILGEYYVRTFVIRASLTNQFVFVRLESCSAVCAM